MGTFFQLEHPLALISIRASVVIRTIGLLRCILHSTPARHPLGMHPFGVQDHISFNPFSHCSLREASWSFRGSTISIKVNWFDSISGW